MTAFCSDHTELISTFHSDFPAGLFQPLAWDMVIFKMVTELFIGLCDLQSMNKPSYLQISNATGHICRGDKMIIWLFVEI